MSNSSTPQFFADGIPTLNQSIIDSQLKHNRTNELTSFNSDIRDQIYNAGWKQKSDAVKVLNGAAIFGLKPRTRSPMGGDVIGGSTDAELIAAAKQLGIDPNKFITRVPGFVQMGIQRPASDKLNQDALYNAIDNQTKNLYSVTNATTGFSNRGDAVQHATILYKSDGKGNLVAVNNQQTGQPIVNYSNQVSYHKAGNILSELAPFIGIAGLAFGLPAITGAIGDAGVGAATLASAGEAAGLTASEMGAGAALEGGLPGVIAGGTGTMAGTTLGLGGELIGDTAAIASGLEGINAVDSPINNPPSNGPDINDVKDAVKTGKSLYNTAKQVNNLINGGNSNNNGSGNDGSGALASAVPTFLDSTPEFLRSNRQSSNSSGLRTVNQAAQQDVKPIDDTSTTEQPMPKQEEPQAPLGYASAGTVEKNVGDLTQTIKDWNNAFCTKKSDPQFSKICDKPEFNYASKSVESHKLKPLRQTRINPLATGGLPHKYAAAAPKGHKPEFITGMTGYYACGAGTGQSDDIPAMLHDGDYVMDAETVSALGDGSSKAGHHVLEGFRTQIPHKKEGGSNPVPAKIADGEYVFPSAFVTALGGGDNKRGAEILDGLRTKLRAHKRGAPLDKIPPKAKDPIEYIKAGSK